jgi:hypothetical protein
MTINILEHLLNYPSQKGRDIHFSLLTARAALRPAAWRARLNPRRIEQSFKLPPQPLQGIVIHRVIDPARVIRVALASDQPHLPQDLQMVRDQAQGKLQPGGDFAVALRTLHQQVKDRQPGWVAERLEHLVQRVYALPGIHSLLDGTRNIIKHTLNYIRKHAVVKSPIALSRCFRVSQYRRMGAARKVF